MNRNILAIMFLCVSFVYFYFNKIFCMITLYSLTLGYKITYRIHTNSAIKDFIQRSNIRRTK